MKIKIDLDTLKKNWDELIAYILLGFGLILLAFIAYSYYMARITLKCVGPFC